MGQARVKEQGIAGRQRREHTVGFIERAGVHRRGVIGRVEECPLVSATEDLEAAIFGIRWIEGDHEVYSAKLPNAAQRVSKKKALVLVVGETAADAR